MRSPSTPPFTPRIPALSRRTLLRLAGGAAAAAVAAGCGSRADDRAAEEVDPLLAEEARAREDAAGATAAARARPDLAGAFAVVAAERTAHADALAAEIARLTPTSAATGTPTAEPSASEPAADPAPAPTVEEMRASLSASSASAATLARTLSGYRAGLLGSISAACAVEVSAVLA